MTNRRIQVTRPALFILATFTLLVAISLPAASSADAAKTRCTIKGTKGPDKLFGTRGRDVICGFGGNDTLTGRGGNDTLIGGPGNDRLLGFAGADLIQGADGDDTIRGGFGPDDLYGQTGDDKLLGEPQDDKLFGGPGDDFLDGGTGTNRIDGGTGINRCLATAADTLAGTCDNSPPVISDVVVSPESIDTWEAARNVTVTWRATDDRTGLDLNAQILMAHHEASDQFNYNGAWAIALPQMTSGDEHDATFEATLTVPRFSPKGRWSLDFQSHDHAGNYLRLEKPELLALGLPTGFNQTGAGDDTAPVISDFTIDRTTVDTSGSEQVINASVRVTDTISGVNIENTNGVSFSAGHQASQQSADDTCERVSGDKFDGIYDCSLTIRRYAAKGDWKYGVWARDFAENSASFGAAEEQAMGLPQFISQIGPGDTTPPQLVELSVSPAHVDTTSGPQTVNFHMRQTDDLSGVWPEGDFNLNMFVNGAQTPLNATMTKVSGNLLDATYEGSLTLPQGSTHGTWNTTVIVGDLAGNYKFFTPAQQADLGFQSSFTNGP